jgi:hypothetical protein
MPPPLRVRRAEPVPDQHQRGGPRRTHRPGQRSAEPAVGGQPDPGERGREPGALGRDPNVRAERQPEPGPDTRALHATTTGCVSACSASIRGLYSSRTQAKADSGPLSSARACSLRSWPTQKCLPCAASSTARTASRRRAPVVRRPTAHRAGRHRARACAARWWRHRRRRGNRHRSGSRSLPCVEPLSRLAAQFASGDLVAQELRRGEALAEGGVQVLGDGQAYVQADQVGEPQRPIGCL